MKSPSQYTNMHECYKLINTATRNLYFTFVGFQNLSSEKCSRYNVSLPVFL